MKKIELVFILLFFIEISGNAQVKNAAIDLSSRTDGVEYHTLKAFANTLNVIDAHEHLLSPEDHAKQYLSFYNFFSDYVRWDLYGAGVPKKYLDFKPKNDAEATEIFNVIEPFLPYVENGSYMLSVKAALQKFFGVDKITRANYQEIGRKLNAANTADNYRKIMSDAHIVKILEQSYFSKTTPPLFENITTISWQFDMENALTKMCREHKDMTLRDVVDYYTDGIKKEKAGGSIGLKFFPHVFIEPYDTTIAKKQFEEIKNGVAFNERSTLARYIYEEQIKIATANKMVIAIHLGVWSDITDKTPSILFPIVSKYPDATFDIYHMGIPYIRETAFLGKNYPNVYLNLCRAFSVSENMALNSLDEWIDLVPTNKIIGFGGDVITLPQHAVGMFEVAKHVLCKALAKRINENRLDMDGAKKILAEWLYNNPAKVYGIKLN